MRDVVAATTRWGTTTEVVYAVSTNNGVAFPTSFTLGIPPNGDQPAMAYPTALYTVSGGVKQFWLGASGTKPDTTTGVYVAQMNQGNTVFNYADTAIQHAPGVNPITRPLFSQHAFDSDLFLSFLEDLGGCATGAVVPPPSVFGLTSPDFSQSWSNFQVKPLVPPTACDYRGRNPAIAVRDTGELVVVSADVDVRTSGNTPVWLNNNGLPFVTWSENGGASWLPSAGPVQIGFNSGIAAPQPGDAIAIDGGELLPYTAINRRVNNDDYVYVLFAGRATPTTGDVDMYIAWSRDGGKTFDNNDILHLTDLMLHGIDASPEGPDQIPAGIAIDTCGGVHILWYDTIGDTPGLDVTIDVFTAFIDDFSLPTQTIDVTKLTSQPFSVGTMTNPVFLGERQSLTLAQRGFGGLWQLACFAMVENGLVNTHVQRVRTANSCSSGPGGPAALDANTDGWLDGSDMTEFATQWQTDWPNADYDGDGDVDNDDFVLYVTEYDQFNSGE